ncbi:extracellular function secreted protein [Geitlerinema sp. FC II]|nr:extracellular function secreted protein [Geitlerinema sp. FC II]
MFIFHPQLLITFSANPKYLYGNANPVNFVDPSGLFALTEQLSAFEVGSILAGIGVVGIVVTNDPPPPVPFPFPGEGSIPGDINTRETFPNNDGILDRLLDFGRRMGGFGEGPNEDLAERIPGFGEGTTTDDLVSYVFFNNVNDVITETYAHINNPARINNPGRNRNITSSYSLTPDEALDLGIKFLGPNYTQRGRSDSGVFTSADGLRQFRIDNASLSGNHDPWVPHVHIEIFNNPGDSKPIVNNHIPLTP